MPEDFVAEKAFLDKLEKRVAELLFRDRYSIFDQVHRIKQRIHAGDPVDRMLYNLERSIAISERYVLTPIAERIQYTFPENLPITSHVNSIREAMQSHQAVIICGTTGSGKTTQLPKIALEIGQGRYGRIGCTQPRRLAATAMARRVASEMNVQCGREVGYQVRFDNRTCADTVIKFMTDGILLAETQNDGMLLQYDTLIIDEVHERSLNIDFIIGYLKNLMRKRPELKIIISSATLEADNFSKFFNNAPVINIEGRTYPVEDFFLPPEEDEDLYSHIGRAVNWISEVDRHGDILVFLPGEREIREATDLLNGWNLPHTEVLPLFARLSMSDQQRVFSPGQRRRIILATNVAETSVTIPGIHFVIDSGFVRLSRFNPRNQIQELHIEQVSQASARQRRGRCGRIADGICVYLYEKERLEASQPYTDPEIRRTCLAGVILQMAMLGLPPIEHFPFLDAPQPALIREGYRTLRDIGAIDKDGRITAEGRQIAALPLDPRLAKTICYARRGKVLPEIMVICSFLSIQDPRERPADQHQAADQAHHQWRDEDSDFITILKLWNFIQKEHAAGTSNSGIRKFCHRNFLNYNRLREWNNLYLDLCEAVSDEEWGVSTAAGIPQEEFSYDMIHKTLLSGVPGNIGMYDREEAVFIGAGNRKFHIFPGSGLHKRKPVPPWVMTFALVSTAKVFARHVAVIKPEWIEEVAPHLCTRTYDNVHWDKNSGFVFAKEKVIFGGLLINAGRRVHYGKLCPAEARIVFIREGMVPGELNSSGKWLKKHQQMLETIQILEEKIRRPGTLLDPEAIFEHFSRLLPGDICSAKILELWLEESGAEINIRMEDAMQEQFTPLHPEDFPDEIIFSGHVFELKYRFAPGEPDDGICLLSTADEMNLIPEWGLEWLVPGRLAEKVELLIKSLPKAQRMQCSPVTDTATDFVQEVKDEKISMEQPLETALAAYLTRAAGGDFHPRDFNTEKMPDALIMKIAEIGGNGKIVALHHQVPAELSAGSRLSAAVKGVGKWILAGSTEWPEGDLPESILLPGEEARQAFPALTDADGGMVGRQVFLDCRESEYCHHRGLIKLFRNAYAGQLKVMKKYFQLSSDLQLCFFVKDHTKGYSDDFADAVILAALTAEDSITIRAKDVFAERAEVALADLAGLAEKRVAMLEQMAEQYTHIRELLKKSKGRAHENCADAQAQLEFLFRPGFLRDEAVWSRYPRYLKALAIRAERIHSAPQKDSEKMQPLLPFAERFELAAATVKDFELAFDLKDFWLLLEEFRIMQFAPEVRPLEKISATRLQETWDRLRL
jgi:ATP-dependent helicase HrpA